MLIDFGLRKSAIMIPWPNKALGTDRIALGQAELAKGGGQGQGQDCVSSDHSSP